MSCAVVSCSVKPAPFTRSHPVRAFVLTDHDPDVSSFERRAGELSAALELLFDIEAHLVAIPGQTLLNVLHGQRCRDGAGAKSLGSDRWAKPGIDWAGMKPRESAVGRAARAHVGVTLTTYGKRRPSP